MRGREVRLRVAACIISLLATLCPAGLLAQRPLTPMDIPPLPKNEGTPLRIDDHYKELDSQLEQHVDKQLQRLERDLGSKETGYNTPGSGLAPGSPRIPQVEEVQSGRRGATGERAQSPHSKNKDIPGARGTTWRSPANKNIDSNTDKATAPESTAGDKAHSTAGETRVPSINLRQGASEPPYGGKSMLPPTGTSHSPASLKRPGKGVIKRDSSLPTAEDEASAISGPPRPLQGQTPFLDPVNDGDWGLPSLISGNSPAIRWPLISPNLKNLKRYIFDGFIGMGSGDGFTTNLYAGVRFDSFVLGLQHEGSTWLDASTNTGKALSSIQLEFCGLITMETRWSSIQPCFRFGSAVGEYKDRNQLNEIVSRKIAGESSKFFGRYLLVVPVGDRRVAIDGRVGFSSDPLLFGRFIQVWIRAPRSGLAVGVETYINQRTTLSIGYSVGFVDMVGE